MPESSPYDTYTSPLAARNASAQHELGLPVSKEQVEELRAVVTRPGGITDAEMKAAEKYERELRHDVMAHVHALGDSCPKAKGIIHLGMTSQDVVCNADLMIVAQAIELTNTKSTRCVLSFVEQAKKHLQTPTLSFTHYQAAQPLTVGRRCAEWAYELRLTSARLAGHADQQRLKGFRGATGTQASYLSLCDGDHAKVDRLEASILRRLLGQPSASLPAAQSLGADVGFTGEAMAFLTAAMQQIDTPAGFIAANAHALVTQNYPRVVDTFILADLASTASVLHKVATDIRLLCNRKELDEPFEDKQIGSSAMPYKRNPMRCERICGLTRFVMNLVGNAYDTAATQWLERTLDDSSNRRLSLPEAFLALDGALDLMHNVASGLVVHEATVRKNLMAELPFMATENLLMACVKAGGDRQEYHEHIRAHAQAAGLRVKQEGQDNDLLDRLKADPAFHTPALKSELDWNGLMDPMKYIGRSVEQTERFINEVVGPLREQYGDAIAKLHTSGPKV